jgi:[acyl-carrier-protein] S-malonyltransferase
MFDWSKTAFIFPGQGSQRVGMCRELAAAYPVARQTFEEADDILGYPLSQMCFQGPEADLNETLNTQPALFTAGVAALRALQSHFPQPLHPGYTAGHSLGELTAYVAAGAFSFEDGLRLVRRRAELMHTAGEHAPGGVAALLGLDREAILEICDEIRRSTGGMVVLANDNCPGQAVISGDEAALEAAMALAGSRGAKKAMRLPVSVAVHSPLMQPAGEAFYAAVEQTPIHKPLVPVVGNVGASLMYDVGALKEELERQIASAVLWADSVQTMLDAGVTHFIEFGPGGVLVGLVKRISREAKRSSLETPADVLALVQDIQGGEA